MRNIFRIGRGVSIFQDEEVVRTNIHSEKPGNIDVEFD